MPGSTEIRELGFHELCIPFKAAFRHASAERTETCSVWIEARSGTGRVGYGESCPRPYVTGESIASARAFLARHESALCAEVVDLPALRKWMEPRAEELDANPAAWCAIEMAILDLLSRDNGQTVEVLLGLPPLAGRFRYSAILGDAEPEAFRRTFDGYRRMGFTDFKIKLSGDLERDRAKVGLLRELGEEHPRIRVDANNLWDSADEAIRFLQRLDCPLFAVEEPIRPHQYSELAKIGDVLGCHMILDESFVRVGQFVLLDASRARWLVNLRVSKMGGLLRSLRVADEAKAAGIGLVLGAQVGETSLLSRAALTVAQAAREALVAQEGAFGTLLLTEDVCDTPLMFGAGGILDIAAYPSVERPGFGVIDAARPDRYLKM